MNVAEAPGTITISLITQKNELCVAETYILKLSHHANCNVVIDCPNLFHLNI